MSFIKASIKLQLYMKYVWICMFSIYVCIYNLNLKYKNAYTKEEYSSF